MAISRKIVTIALFVLTLIVARASVAQQIELMRDEHYNDKLASIINNNMGEAGRARLNHIFERSKSNSWDVFTDANNEFKIILVETFSSSKNSNQPCRQGKLIAIIGTKKYLIEIVGCRNGQGVWSIGRSFKGGLIKDKSKNMQPPQPVENPSIDETDELILD